MAKTRGSGRPASSTTHSSSPPTSVVPLAMADPTSTPPTPLSIVSGPPFTVPGADKPREPQQPASSSTGDKDDPDVTIEEPAEPISSPPPSQKRKSRVSLRVLGQSSGKKQRTEKAEIGAKAKLDGFRRRKIIRGMAVDIPWLIENSGTSLVELLRKQGWETLFGEKFQNLVYDSEIAEFYCHMSVGDDDVCSTIVKGEGLEFDAAKLGEILGVPSVGYAIHSKKGVPELDYANVEDLVALYSQKTCNTASSFHQDALTPFHKLIYNLVRRSLVPRAQKRASVEVLDVIYLDLLVTGKQINFPLLMIRHMSYMRAGNNFSLPYAPLITTILNHFQVSLTSEGKSIGSSDILGKVALENLGVEIRNGEFVFAKDEIEEIEVVPKSKVALRKQPKEQGTSSQDVSGSFVHSLLKEFREEIRREFDKLDRRVGSLFFQVEGLKREVASLRDSTTITSASLATTLVKNHATVMKKLNEFEGTTVEEEVEEEQEESNHAAVPIQAPPAPVP